jgi:hypothetical protein
VSQGAEGYVPVPSPTTGVVGQGQGIRQLLFAIAQPGGSVVQVAVEGVSLVDVDTGNWINPMTQAQGETIIELLTAILDKLGDD